MPQADRIDILLGLPPDRQFAVMGHMSQEERDRTQQQMDQRMQERQMRSRTAALAARPSYVQDIDKSPVKSLVVQQPLDIAAGVEEAVGIDPGSGVSPYARNLPFGLVFDPSSILSLPGAVKSLYQGIRDMPGPTDPRGAETLREMWNALYGAYQRGSQNLAERNVPEAAREMGHAFVAAQPFKGAVETAAGTADIAGLRQRLSKVGRRAIRKGPEEVQIPKAKAYAQEKGAALSKQGEANVAALQQNVGAGVNALTRTREAEAAYQKDFAEQARQYQQDLADRKIELQRQVSDAAEKQDAAEAKQAAANRNAASVAREGNIREQQRYLEEVETERENAATAARERQEAEANLARRTELETTLREGSPKLKEFSEDLDKKLGPEANDMYRDVEKAWAKDPGIEGSTLMEDTAAEKAKIMGTSETPPIFKSIERRSGAGEMIDLGGGELQSLQRYAPAGAKQRMVEPQHVLGYYRELNNLLENRNLPSDVFQAVEGMRNRLKAHLDTIAKRTNTEALLNRADNFYFNYRRLLHDPDSALGVVRKAFKREKNLGTLWRRFMKSEADEAAIQRLRTMDTKYRADLDAFANFLENMRTTARELERPEIGKAKAPEPETPPTGPTRLPPRPTRTRDLVEQGKIKATAPPGERVPPPEPMPAPKPAPPPARAPYRPVEPARIPQPIAPTPGGAMREIAEAVGATGRRWMEMSPWQARLIIGGSIFAPLLHYLPLGDVGGVNVGRGAGVAVGAMTAGLLGMKYFGYLLNKPEVAMLIAAPTDDLMQATEHLPQPEKGIYQNNLRALIEEADRQHRSLYVAPFWQRFLNMSPRIGRTVGTAGAVTGPIQNRREAFQQLGRNPENPTAQ